MKYCPRCGTRLSKNAIFCPNCGYQVNPQKNESKLNLGSSQNRQKYNESHDSTYRRIKNYFLIHPMKFSLIMISIIVVIAILGYRENTAPMLQIVTNMIDFAIIAAFLFLIAVTYPKWYWLFFKRIIIIFWGTILLLIQYDINVWILASHALGNGPSKFTIWLHKMISNLMIKNGMGPGSGPGPIGRGMANMQRSAINSINNSMNNAIEKHRINAKKQDAREEMNLKRHKAYVNNARDMANQDYENGHYNSTGDQYYRNQYYHRWNHD